jgi:peptide/nickel transport system permease protein
MAGQQSPVLYSQAPPYVDERRRFLRVFFSRKVVIFGLAIMLVFILTASMAAWIAPYDPYKQDMTNPLGQPCSQHLLGTDQVGRDTLSRLIYGARTALVIGFTAVLAAAAIGILLGVIAGYYGGIGGMIIMRFIDALMPFPTILLALVIAAVLGGGLKNVIIALAISTIPPYARIMFGETLSVKENDYIKASKAFGANNGSIIFEHILPNTFQPIIVQMTLQLGGLILAEASLSFLGIGIEPPGAAWGSMVFDGYRYLITNAVLSFAPGVAIMLVVFGFNMVGDGLRDALDPRLRGTF